MDLSAFFNMRNVSLPIRNSHGLTIICYLKNTLTDDERRLVVIVQYICSIVIRYNLCNLLHVYYYIYAPTITVP
jgi:hypothetical protein